MEIVDEIKLHNDFESIVPSIPDAKTLHQLIKEFIPLTNDCRVGKPINDVKLSEDDLLNFKIDLEKWDRLYYFDYSLGDYRKFGRFHGRMEYNGKLVFFEFYFHYCENDISRIHVFMSADVDLFMKSVLNEEDHHIRQLIKLIRQSLDNDGIYLDENIEDFIEYYNVIKKQDPSQNAVEEYLKRDDILPKFLMRKIDDLKEFIALRNYYESDEWL